MIDCLNTVNECVFKLLSMFVFAFETRVPRIRYRKMIFLFTSYPNNIDIRSWFTNKNLGRITSTLIRSRRNNERLIGREWKRIEDFRFPEIIVKLFTSAFPLVAFQFSFRPLDRCLHDGLFVKSERDWLASLS